MVEELVRIDVASWSHLNQATVGVLQDARERGFSMSVLSNAPREMAAALHAHPAFAIFDQLIFSSEIGVVKPSAGAFRAALEKLSREPEEVLFIDDRPDNVSAALALGLAAIEFRSADQLRTRLSERTGR